MGLVYMNTGEMERALTCHEQALAIIQAIGDRGWQAAILNNLGLLYDRRGEGEQALEYYRQALGIRQSLNDRPGLQVVYYNMAQAYRKGDNLAQAERLLEQAVALDEALQLPTLERDRSLLLEVRTQRNESQENLREKKSDNFHVL